MKTPLLMLSLAANVALLAGVAYLSRTPRTHQPTDTTKASAGLDRPKSDSPGQGKPTHSTDVPPAAPLRGAWQSADDVEVWLRSTGAPLKVRFAVVQGLLNEKYAAASSAIRHPPGLKRWQRSIPPSPEQREQLSALRLEQKQELQRIFGADYAKAVFAENIRELTGIPAEKLVELNRVTADYAETRMKFIQSGKGLSPEARRLMDEEMNADLRRILTPEKFESHQAYETQDAQNLQRSLAGLDIDDETYLKIYRASAAVKNSNKQPAHLPSVRVEEIRAIERAVGPEIAAHLSMNQDSTYREIGTLYATAKLPAADMIERYELWNQFHQNLPNAAPGKLDDVQKSVVSSYYERLTEGLSATARADFDRTKTGAFMGRLLRTN